MAFNIKVNFSDGAEMHKGVRLSDIKNEIATRIAKTGKYGPTITWLLRITEKTINNGTHAADIMSINITKGTNQTWHMTT